MQTVLTQGLRYLSDGGTRPPEIGGNVLLVLSTLALVRSKRPGIGIVGNTNAGRNGRKEDRPRLEAISNLTVLSLKANACIECRIFFVSFSAPVNRYNVTGSLRRWARCPQGVASESTISALSEAVPQASHAPSDCSPPYRAI